MTLQIWMMAKFKEDHVRPNHHKLPRTLGNRNPSKHVPRGGPIAMGLQTSLGYSPLNVLKLWWGKDDLPGPNTSAYQGHPEHTGHGQHQFHRWIHHMSLRKEQRGTYSWIQILQLRLYLHLSQPTHIPTKIAWHLQIEMPGPHNQIMLKYHSIYGM